MSDFNKVILEAKSHFAEHGGMIYGLGDKASISSKEINERLKELLVKKFKDYPEMELNIQGSKWSVQGQSKLSDGVWYRAFFKKFGNKYPIVFGIYLGSAGLNFAIQIYNNVLENNSSLSKKLGLVIRDALINKGLEEQKRHNPKEEYSDFGFFNLLEFNEEKFVKVLQVYQESVYFINDKLFERVELEFKKAVGFNSNEELKSFRHVNVSQNADGFFKQKEAISEKFMEFLSNPSYENLEWWDKCINSANMQGNRTNLIKKFEDLKVEEIKNLEPTRKLYKVQSVFKEIEKLVFESPGKVRDDLTCESLNQGVAQIEGMNATARELAYYLQFKTDKIPLLNATSEDSIKFISTVTSLLEGVNNTQERIDKLISRMESLLNVPKVHGVLPEYYVIDQFFNLLHKVSIAELAEKNNQELYQFAYLFSNLLGKADTKPINKNGFIDEIKNGQNIIYYGAPGTGKTFGVKNNILSIVKDDDQLEWIQFHPSYSYEDFIEGIKPTGIINGVMGLELKDGVFKNFCEKAKHKEAAYINALSVKNGFENAVWEFAYFFVVDEINRAELSRVLGELLYCLEYRGVEGKIRTQYASLRDGSPFFYIPKNVFFIGTMNDVDRSIDSFDLALRRRFMWVRKECDYDVIESILNDRLTEIEGNIGRYREACVRLNNEICNTMGLGDKYQLGQAYFLKIINFRTSKGITQLSLSNLFEFHLEPLLREYLRSEYGDSDIKEQMLRLSKSFNLNP